MLGTAENGEPISIPVGPDGQHVVTMRTTSASAPAGVVTGSHHHHHQDGGNMSLGTDPTSLAAAAGNVNIASTECGGLVYGMHHHHHHLTHAQVTMSTVAVANSRGRTRTPTTKAGGGGTKRRVIGNIVRSAVREGRNMKRQKIMAENNKRGSSTKKKGGGVAVDDVGGDVPPTKSDTAATAEAPDAVPSTATQVSAEVSSSSASSSSTPYTVVPNPLPAISQVLDPYVSVVASVASSSTTSMGTGMPPPPSTLASAPAPFGSVTATSTTAGNSGAAKTSAVVQRGRQQLVHTAGHGTLPMAALEDAVFRLLTPATGAPASHHQAPSSTVAAAAATAVGTSATGGIVDPLKIPLNHTQYPTPPTTSTLTTITVSPTGVSENLMLPSWVDAKNPPQWYNDGGDIDTLLDDADCLNWLSDTGDLDETYPPALVEPAAVISGSNSTVVVASSAPSGSVANNCIASDMEPNPVNVTQDPTGGVVHHPSTDSLSFLVDHPPAEQQQPAVAPAPVEVHHEPAAASQEVVVKEVDQLPSFLEDPPPPPVEQAPTSATEALMAGTASDETGGTGGGGDIPKLAGVSESVTNLMGFPDMDMGDEQAFVQGLLEGSGQSTMSFPKLDSAIDMSGHQHPSSAALTQAQQEKEAEEEK